MKKWSFVALLVVGGTVLGATMLREPVALAAQAISATIVGPLDANGNVMVHEQGTANVSVAQPAPITDGANSHATSCPDNSTLGQPAVATALSIHMDSTVAEVSFDTVGAFNTTARFPGPAAAGNASIVLALTRPISFDRIHCIGTGSYSVSWIGNQP